MKNLLLSTALVLSTATFASAEAHSQMALQVDNYLASSNVDVDVDSLTMDQITSLYTTITSESGGEKLSDIRAVLNEQNVVYEDEEDMELMVAMPRSQLRAAVLANSENLGLSDVRIRTLNNDQLAQLYLLINSNQPDKVTDAQIIIN